MSIPDTASLAQYGTMAQTAGAGMSLVGSINQANTQKGVLDYQAGLAANNALIAHYQQAQELQQGQIQENAQRMKTAALMGDQRTALAASGVDMGQGSASEILASSKYMGERDALTIRDNAARRAWGYGVNADNYNAESAAEKSAAGAISPFTAGAGSLLAGSAGVAKSWYAYRKSTGG
jgi:hypothetical protein